jgi:hypothetical protein
MVPMLSFSWTLIMSSLPLEGHDWRRVEGLHALALLLFRTAELLQQLCDHEKERQLLQAAVDNLQSSLKGVLLQVQQLEGQIHERDQVGC